MDRRSANLNAAGHQFDRACDSIHIGDTRQCAQTPGAKRRMKYIFGLERLILVIDRQQGAAIHVMDFTGCQRRCPIFGYTYVERWRCWGCFAEERSIGITEYTISPLALIENFFEFAF